MKNQAQPPTRFFRRLVPALLLALALGTGCADDAVARTRDDGDDALLVVVPEVSRDPEGLEQTVHARILRVCESDVRHERPHGLPADDRRLQAGLPTDVVRAVDAHDQRSHWPNRTGVDV